MRSALETLTAPVGWLADANVSYQRWRVRQADRFSIAGPSTLSRAGAEVSLQITEAVRGIMPKSVYERADAPIREAHKIIQSIDAAPIPEGAVQGPAGTMVDTGKIASRLNSMIYDPKWVKSSGQEHSQATWGSLHSDSEPWFYRSKSVLGGDDNVAVIWEQEGVRYVSFRGSVSAENWIHNAQMSPTTLSGGVQVHSGTWRQWQAMKPALQEQLQKPFNGRTVFTGHSLGGMLAHVAAYDMQIPDAGVISFGSPPVLNEAGAQSLNSMTSFDVRYENEDDAIPQLLSNSYVKSGQQVRLTDPLHSIKALQHQVPVTPHGASELSAAAGADPAYSKFTEIGAVALQFAGWKAGRHDPHNYASLYDYHSAGPYTRMAIMEQAIKTYSTKLAGALEERAISAGATAAAAASIRAKQAELRAIAQNARNMLSSVAEKELGPGADALIARVIGAGEWTAGVVSAAGRIVTPFLIAQTISQIAEAGLTAQNMDAAEEMIRQAVEAQVNSEEFQNAAQVIAQEFERYDGYGSLMQLAQADVGSTVMYDSANPANIFFGSITDPGYADWALTVQGDEQLGSPSSTMGQIYDDMYSGRQLPQVEQEPLPSVDQFIHEDSLRDRHELEQDLESASHAKLTELLDQDFTTNTAGEVTNIFFNVQRDDEGTCFVWGPG